MSDQGYYDNVRDLTLAGNVGSERPILHATPETFTEMLAEAKRLGGAVIHLGPGNYTYPGQGIPANTKLIGAGRDQLAELLIWRSALAPTDRRRKLLGWAIEEVKRLRRVIEGAAWTAQALGEPTIRDNLLGAIGDHQSRLPSAAIEYLRLLVVRLEWPLPCEDNNEDCRQCATCRGHRGGVGHEDGCEVAAALKPEGG